MPRSLKNYDHRRLRDSVADESHRGSGEVGLLLELRHGPTLGHYALQIVA